jgi:hypothetical protein
LLDVRAKGTKEDTSPATGAAGSCREVEIVAGVVAEVVDDAAAAGIAVAAAAVGPGVNTGVDPDTDARAGASADVSAGAAAGTDEAESEPRLVSGFNVRSARAGALRVAPALGALGALGAPGAPCDAGNGRAEVSRSPRAASNARAVIDSVRASCETVPFGEVTETLGDAD